MTNWCLLPEMSCEKHKIKPYQSNEENAVPLNFNYWCGTSDDASVEVADIADLIASLCTKTKISSLPHFLEPSFQENSTTQVVVLCVVTGSPKRRTPFLSSCTSVPVSFTKSARHLRQLSFPNDSPKDFSASASDVMLVNALLLWPKVPSTIPFDQSPMNLFSQHRLIFSAYHTDWNDEIVLQSDLTCQAALTCAINLHNSPLSISSGTDIYGTFTRNSVNGIGYFIIQENAMLHLYFSGEEKEYIALQKIEVTESNEDVATNLIDLHFRSVRSSHKSDVILHLSLIDVKASKYSTAIAMNTNRNVEVVSDPLISEELSSDLKNEITQMSKMFLDCCEQFPNCYEGAVCSPRSLEMLGFSLPGKEANFVSTASWSATSPFIFKNKSHLLNLEELEDGEEREEYSDKTEHELIAMIRHGEKLSICALDCEMCCTDKGTELTRISVLCPVNGLVLDTLVKPERRITNYNFEYSGINEEMLSNVSYIFPVHNLRAQLPH